MASGRRLAGAALALIASVTTSVHASPSPLCEEVKVELDRAVRMGYVDELQAVKIYERCIQRDSR